MFVDSVVIKIINKSTYIYGQGNKLIFETFGIRNVNKIKIYDKIHQISFRKVNENSIEIACAAGREILFGKIIDNEFHECFLTKFNDWISSVKILDDGNIVALTAHNFLGLIQINNLTADVVKKIDCLENATLYCSSIIGNCWDDLIIFGGTALGELVIWKAKDGNILNRQFLHNGVIFSIDFDGTNLLTSSDDRSIKLFHVNDDFKLCEKKQMFGHTSRVFTCKIINFQNDIAFLSAGEDSNLCVWSSTGEILLKKNVNSSGILWSVDFDPTCEIVVSSSSTGKLNKFDLREIFLESHQIEEIPTLTDRVHPSKVKFLRNGGIVILDNQMNLHLKTSVEKNWKLIGLENSGKFVAMEVMENRLYLVSTISITVCDFDENLPTSQTTIIAEILPQNLKSDYLRSIHVLDQNEICVCDASGLFIVFNPKIRSCTNLFQIPKCYEPWSTSAAKISGFWLVGDRVGNLHLFRQHPPSLSLEIPSQPIFKLNKLHGNLGVTSIRIIDDDFAQTSGSDGNIRTIKVSTSSSTSPPCIEVQRSERTSINSIEKFFTWSNKEFLLGFNDDFFVLYNCGNREIVFEHRCGGRHRCWDFKMIDETTANLIYISKKQLNSVEFHLMDSSWFDNDISSWHVKECNVMSRYGNVLVSGGEDTLMKLMKIDKIDGKLSEITNVNTHISNIKDIQLVKDEDNGDILIISAGGRAQICINRLIKLKTIKEEVNFMLSKSEQYGKSSNFDAETRFTCLSYDERLHQLYVACSDGFIRIFDFDKQSLRLSVEHFYGKCMLGIRILKDFILTTSTDGFIVFWQREKLNGELLLRHQLKHNQSGINCFDIVEKKDGSFLIASGGDDNALFVTQFSIIENSSIHFQPTISNCEIHIAQVTGLKFITECEFFTSSIDQSLCHLKLNNSTSSLELVEKRLTCVADVKGFLHLENDRLAVYGAGLEIL